MSDTRIAGTLELTDEELDLLWMGTETLREANPDNPAALSLDNKVTFLIQNRPDLADPDFDPREMDVPPGGVE